MRYYVHMNINNTKSVSDPIVLTLHPSHVFTGIDGRCYFCDVRPFSRWASQPCSE